MNSIKTLSFNDFPVSFQDNGYLNATAIAQHFNKRVGNYLRREETKDYISALIEHLSIALKSAMTEKQLVISKKGGKIEESGTWLHPKLAIDFARWLNPKFAVWCDARIEEMLLGSLKPKTKNQNHPRRARRTAPSRKLSGRQTPPEF